MGSEVVAVEHEELLLGEEPEILLELFPVAARRDEPLAHSRIAQSGLEAPHLGPVDGAVRVVRDDSLRS